MRLSTAEDIWENIAKNRQKLSRKTSFDYAGNVREEAIKIMTSENDHMGIVSKLESLISEYERKQNA